jgi:hypothetical protein
MAKEDLSAKLPDSMTKNGQTCGTSMNKTKRVENIKKFFLCIKQE